MNLDYDTSLWRDHKCLIIRPLSKEEAPNVWTQEEMKLWEEKRQTSENVTWLLHSLNKKYNATTSVKVNSEYSSSVNPGVSDLSTFPAISGEPNISISLTTISNTLNLSASPVISGALNFSTPPVISGASNISNVHNTPTSNLSTSPITSDISIDEKENSVKKEKLVEKEDLPKKEDLHEKEDLPKKENNDNGIFKYTQYLDECYCDAMSRIKNPLAEKIRFLATRELSRDCGNSISINTPTKPFVYWCLGPGSYFGDLLAIMELMNGPRQVKNFRLIFINDKLPGSFSSELLNLAKKDSKAKLDLKEAPNSLKDDIASIGLYLIMDWVRLNGGRVELIYFFNSLTSYFRMLDFIDVKLKLPDENWKLGKLELYNREGKPELYGGEEKLEKLELPEKEELLGDVCVAIDHYDTKGELYMKRDKKSYRRFYENMDMLNYNASTYGDTVCIIANKEYESGYYSFISCSKTRGKDDKDDRKYNYNYYIKCINVHADIIFPVMEKLLNFPNYTEAPIIGRREIEEKLGRDKFRVRAGVWVGVSLAVASILVGTVYMLSKRKRK